MAATGSTIGIGRYTRYSPISPKGFDDIQMPFGEYYRLAIENRLVIAAHHFKDKFLLKRAGFSLADLNEISEKVSAVFKEVIQILVSNQDRFFVEKYLNEFREARNILVKGQNETMVKLLEKQFKEIQSRSVVDLREIYKLHKSYTPPVLDQEATPKEERFSRKGSIDEEEFYLEDCFAGNMALEKKEKTVSFGCHNFESPYNLESPYKSLVGLVEEFKF